MIDKLQDTIKMMALRVRRMNGNFYHLTVHSVRGQWHPATKSTQSSVQRSGCLIKPVGFFFFLTEYAYSVCTRRHLSAYDRLTGLPVRLINTNELFDLFIDVRLFACSLLFSLVISMTLFILLLSLLFCHLNCGLCVGSLTLSHVCLLLPLTPIAKCWQLRITREIFWLQCVCECTDSCQELRYCFL